jgi:hypothetical protein
VKRLDENIRILQQFKINEWYLVRKLNLQFMQICMVMTSFVFSSWIIIDFTILYIACET